MSVEFTDKARAALKVLLDSEAHEPGQVIRMITNIEGDHHLVFDAPKDSDERVEYEGELILVVAKNVADHLVEHHPGATLDVKDGPDGPVLALD